MHAVGAVTGQDDLMIDPWAIAKDPTLEVKFKELKAHPLRQALVVNVVGR